MYNQCKRSNLKYTCVCVYVCVGGGWSGVCMCGLCLAGPLVHCLTVLELLLKTGFQLYQLLNQCAYSQFELLYYDKFECVH